MGLDRAREGREPLGTSPAPLGVLWGEGCEFWGSLCPSSSEPSPACAPVLCDLSVTSLKVQIVGDVNGGAGIGHLKLHY